MISIRITNFFTSLTSV